MARAEPTISFYENGRLIAHPVLMVPRYMATACSTHGIDRADMAAVASRLIRDEEARETFEDWTGLEVVLREAGQ
jgi:hypothetical protein